MNNKIDTMQKVILTISFFVIIFISIFNIVSDKYLVGSKFDSRSQRFLKSVYRGNIYDRNNNLINFSKKDENTYKRYYNYPKLYSHIAGYLDEKYGSSEVEKKFNSYLSGIKTKNIITYIKNSYSKIKCGEHIKLTLDNELQNFLSKQLRGLEGAIIVSNAINGEILGAYSNPTFDERKIKESIESEDSSLLDRVTRGSYTPGSTFKLISYLSVLDSGLDKSYKDNGFIEIDGTKISNYGGMKYGDIDLNIALTHSINTYFIDKLADRTKVILNNINKLNEGYKKIKAIDFNEIKLSELDNNFKKALLTIGQGPVTLSPMSLHLITNMIYNEGYIIEPHYVKSIVSNPITTEYKLGYKKIDFYFKKSDLKLLKDSMINVVKEGTASGFRISDSGGKTGTAELGGNRYNYLFTGFYEKNEPLIITVVVENHKEISYNISANIFKNIINFMEVKNEK